MTTTTISDLAMLQRHTKEWSELLATQKLARERLKYLHSLDNVDSLNHMKDFKFRAEIIIKHNRQLKELAIMAYEEQVLLKEKQYREENPY